MGGRLYTERIDVSAAAVHRSLRLHPNLRLPNVPKGSSPEAIAKYVTEAIARYLSPPKADAEDNDFPCIDVATAIRDHLRPELLKRLRDAKKKRRRETLGLKAEGFRRLPE